MSRPTLDEIGLNTGKKARLRRILFHHGLGNGTAIFLPYDQGLEHGPRDFFPNTDSADPRYIIRDSWFGRPRSCIGCINASAGRRVGS